MEAVMEVDTVMEAPYRTTSTTASVATTRDLTSDRARSPTERATSTDHTQSLFPTAANNTSITQPITTTDSWLRSATPERPSIQPITDRPSFSTKTEVDIINEISSL